MAEKKQGRLLTDKTEKVSAIAKARREAAQEIPQDGEG